MDVTDDRWSVFGVFTVASASSCAPVSFVGYATTYTFTNPTRSTRPDALRLCQLVILPRFQRQGSAQRCVGLNVAHTTTVALGVR